MCMHCSARCSKCKPAEIVGVVCENCGRPAILSREDCLYALGYFKASKGPDGTEDPAAKKRHTCKSCGADLSPAVKEEIPPQPCLYSEIMCGFPCGKRFRPRRDNAVCKKQVFAGKLPEDAKVGAAANPA